MAYIKLKPIPGDPAKAKDMLYEAIKKHILFNALSPISQAEQIDYFNHWWANVLDVTIGENTIDVHQLAGISVQSNALVMYHLAQLTGKVITNSHNGVKIIMVDQNG